MLDRRFSVMVFCQFWWILTDCCEPLPNGGLLKLSASQALGFSSITNLFLCSISMLMVLPPNCQVGTGCFDCSVRECDR